MSLENDPNLQPILVTGAHRSGTTWVGKTLTADPVRTYISEPLNINHPRGIFKAEVLHWYTYIHSGNEEAYLEAFQDTLKFRYHHGLEIKHLSSIKDLLRLVRDTAVFSVSRALDRRPLLKDPFAVFSVPWFRKRLNAQVVIMVRHPLPFVSSLKRLGWTFDFRNLLSQPELINKLPEDYQQEMRAFNGHPEDVIGQGILLWKTIYSRVYEYQSQDSGIIILKHEDLSRNPMDGFACLFETLGLDFSPETKRYIQLTTRGSNPEELAKNNKHAVQLDSQANLNNWKKRLTEKEIERIITSSEEEVRLFYREDAWQTW